MAVGIGRRILFAIRAFFVILFRGQIPGDIATALIGAPVERPPAAAAPPPAPEATHDRAVQLLALLQRDGRLVDFLMEDLGPYPDAQVGAAVRDVHAGCRRALERYIALEAILEGEEDQPVTVGPEVDPASVKVIGNLAGGPPFRGALRHRGWRSVRVDLPPLPDGSGRFVIAPAEIEV